MTNPSSETLTLLQYEPVFGLRNGSPFCIKAEALLAASGQPYVVETWTDPRKAPKGKLPVLRHRGKLIADSTFIKLYLQDTFGIDFDEGLSDAERAVADAFVKLCEEHLYFVLFYARWMEEHNWPVLRDAYFKAIPSLVRRPVAAQLRKQAFKAMHGQGLGRHAREEIYALGAGDLRSLGSFLGDKPFFMGDRPSSVDATVYAWVTSIVDAPLPSPLKDAALSHENLVRYGERMAAHYFG
ncbi:MAG: glutathione S-transferase family protein [Polyangiales bacterium]|nr:glutathione S-transferase family protein [Myxococcales bacterium]MCB9657670.1 glutathione S-transferase family protein [Sandaracinaceae bacterium]